MTVTVIAHADAAAFLARAEPWLLRAEAEYNLILGIASDLAAGRKAAEPPPYLATVEQGGDVIGCLLRTPPHKLAVTALPTDLAPALVDAVSQEFDALPAVLGPAAVAEAFAAEWARRHGLRHRPGQAQRIYQLDRVIPPARPAPGGPRPAGPPDTARVADWLALFMEEADVLRLDPHRMARDLLAERALYFWEDDGPVCLAGATGWTPNGVRLGYVYTPKAARGRGYASALVAWLSQRLLDEGRRFCFLYTDLANPTSNAIYQRVGYQPVADVVDYFFEDRDEH